MQLKPKRLSFGVEEFDGGEFMVCPFCQSSVIVDSEDDLVLMEKEDNITIEKSL